MCAVIVHTCKATCDDWVHKLTCRGGCAAHRSQRTQHGIPDTDMIHAFNHPISVDDLDDGFTIFVGADPAANLLEIGVVDTSDGPIIVHAMSARPKYLR
jgi:hypothetical protein